MTLTIEVDDLAALLPEMLAEVEAGRDVVLARGTTPVAKIERWPMRRSDDADAAVAELRAYRRNFQPITIDESIGWKNEDRR